MICRNCINAIIPTSSNEREKEGIATMIKYGYRVCAVARTPEEKARYVKGDTLCVYKERFKRKDTTK
jgi:hypothetical protein